MFLATDNQGVTIFLTCLFIILTLGIGFLLVRLIKKNVEHFREEDDVLADNILPKTQLVKEINKYIKKIGSFGAATLIYLDIDDFTDMNEIFGHKAGDEILRTVAVRILKELPYRASVCRYKNDEFLIFIKNEDNREAVDKICNNILKEINKPIAIQLGDYINLTASIGVCFYPQAGIEFKELIHNLELSTYVSKRNGGNKLTNYYATLSDDELQNIEYYKEIKNAIHRKEFVLYYQPIIDLENHVIFGAEALMRWNHPTQGVLSPEKFINIMEQSGDIRWVGEWGIENMIRCQQDLLEKHPEMPMVFSLNLSTKQLVNVELANNLIDIARRYNVDPKTIMFEINDFIVYEKIGTIKTNVLKLKDFGFKIAVDGFVLDGYSVQTIQRSPIDVIKLGRSFLTNIDSNYTKERLLDILNEFAKENNHQILAEGIENPEAAVYVKKHGIGVGSGYYFSKPLSVNEFTEYVSQLKMKEQLAEISELEDKEI